MAEEIIISDLEQAPLLTDDMVIAVEDTKNTYSATLAQLRELVNKLFVEKTDIDFNTLTDDGFYQVGGTLTNAPVAGLITWIVQVVKVGTVIVQNAMATDATNYTHQYIRRYSGTSWGSWQDTQDNFVHKTGNETISGNKTFDDVVAVEQMLLNNINNEIDLKNPDYADYWGFIRLSNNGFIIGTKDGSRWLKNINITRDKITSPSPLISDNGTEIATTSWVRQVSALADLSNVSFDGIGSGYVYIGNLLIQFGRLSLQQGNNTVTFNKPFTEKPIIYANSESATEVTRVSANTPELTKMKIYSSYTGNLLTDWLAIGKGV